MCLFMWQRGAFEGVAWGYGAHFYNSIDNFQLPSRRFSIYTADFTVLLSFCLIYTFFFPRGGVIFRNFPASCTIIAIVASCRTSATLKRSKSRWQIADRLFITIMFRFIYMFLKFRAKIVMENVMNCLFCESVKLFVLRISIDWKIWKRMITKI